MQIGLSSSGAKSAMETVNMALVHLARDHYIPRGHWRCEVVPCKNPCTSKNNYARKR